MNENLNDPLPDDLERRLKVLLNGSVDELAGPRPATPPFEPSPRAEAPARRAPWLLPLLAAACVVLVGGGAVTATQLAGRSHHVQPGVTDHPTSPTPTPSPDPTSASPTGVPATSTPTAPATAPGTAPAGAPRSEAPSGGVSGSATSGAQPLETFTVQSDSGTNTTRSVTIWARDVITDCAGHSYGTAVVAFFREHPCRQAHRVLGTTTVNGRTVAYSAVTVDLPSGPNPGAPGNQYAYNDQFAKLEHADGTGSINDLMREGASLPGATRIPADEMFMTLGEDSSVTVFDAWFVDGSPSAGSPVLTTLLNDIYLTKAIFG